MARINSKKLFFNLSSKLFQPINVIPQHSTKNKEKELLSKSHKLMVDLGIIRPSSTGVHTILPLGMRSLEKLRSIVRNEMSMINAQEVKLPHLIDSTLWKKSGRIDNEGFGIFKLEDRHMKEIILSPTNEEVVAELLSNVPQVSYHQLPLLIYQISTKFRDELKPRCGLLKTKEFEMKDLYSFDKCIESAKITYNSVTNAYRNIFNMIGIEMVRVTADTGEMKGLFSHEYHIKNDLGEDTIVCCNNCSHSFNSENKDLTECEMCKSKKFSLCKGIEVGHTFLLGTTYSEAMNARYNSPSSTEFYVMGSYGLGLTRILAAGIEALSSEDRIIWPTSLAPFTVMIITPKDGSKEYEIGKKLSEDIYVRLNEMPHLYNDIIIDDRENMTIGKKLLYAKRTGYPIVLVLGSKVTGDPPLVEIHNTRDNLYKNVSFDEVISIFQNNNDFSLNALFA